jgi:SAM-dependent methyltransferase
MDAIEGRVAVHYGRADLEAAILAAVVAEGKDPEHLRPEDLVAVDEFHVGGREATVDLAGRLSLRPGLRLLDIGSGIGGAARHLAQAHGCHVTGIDLTAGYVEVARALTARVGLDDRVAFRQASALELPFPDARFDGAYTIHVAMNIADKARLYSEAFRVVRPGGFFALYDILAGDGAPLVYPVPWAADASTSFLVDIVELQSLLAAAGLEIVSIRDRRDHALEFFARQQRRLAALGAAPQLGLHLLMGSDAATKIANMRRNVAERAAWPWEVICRRL